MTDPLALTLWLQIFGALAVEVTVVFATVLALQRLTHSAKWRRTIWQGATLTLLALVLCESSGVSRSFIGWFQSQRAAPKPAVTMTVSSFQPVEEGPVIEETVAVPVAVTFPPRLRALVWWPGIVWLLGGVVVAGLTGLPRLLLIFARRDQATDDTDLLARLQSLAQRLGFRQRVRITESAALSGPIAFGILRPTISLPKAFCRDLTPAKRDAVLTHELAHLAARDPVWYALADAATALLWWHPLAWWSRRQLHSASEAAADEASLLVENGPDLLAECLVELGGRLLQSRDLGGLGMAGFRSGLGRRVERLIQLRGQSWRPTARIRSWLAKTIGPVALLMAVTSGVAWMQPRASAELNVGRSWRESLAGRATAALLPSPAPRPLAQVVPKVPSEGSKRSAAPELLAQSVATPNVASTNDVNVLINRGMLLFEEDNLSAAETQFTRALQLQPKLLAASNYLHRIKARKATGILLDRITLDKVSFNDQPLDQVVQLLATKVRVDDPELSFILKPERTPALPGPAANEAATTASLGEVRITLQTPLRNVTLRETLDAVTKVASQPIQYRVEEYAVVFYEKGAGRLYTRSYVIDLPRLLTAMRWALKTDAPEPSDVETGRVPFVGDPVKPSAPLVRSFFKSIDVDLSPPKALFVNERLGALMVRAPLQDLDTIEQAIAVLNIPPIQLTLEVKLAEVTDESAWALGFDWLQASVTNSAVTRVTVLTNVTQRTSPGRATGLGANGETIAAQPLIISGSLTPEQYGVVLRSLEQQRGVDLLSLPKVTTLSGRQAQIKRVDVKYVVTGLDTNRTSGASPVILPLATPHELGPVVDLIPYVAADGHTIQLTAICKIDEFLGYDEANQETVTVSSENGPPVSSVKPRPLFRRRHIASRPTVDDGQTVVLGGPAIQEVVTTKERGEQVSKLVRKHWMVFVTPTIIDPAGNPVHSRSP